MWPAKGDGSITLASSVFITSSVVHMCKGFKWKNG